MTDDEKKNLSSMLRDVKQKLESRHVSMNDVFNGMRVDQNVFIPEGIYPARIEAVRFGTHNDLVSSEFMMITTKIAGTMYDGFYISTFADTDHVTQDSKYWTRRKCTEFRNAAGLAPDEDLQNAVGRKIRIDVKTYISSARGVCNDIRQFLPPEGKCTPSIYGPEDEEFYLKGMPGYKEDDNDSEIF